MNYPRYLKNKILASSKASPIVLLIGGRQTGKTTLMREIGQSRGYDFITLDNLRILGGVREDPQGFIEQHATPLIIDEVQRAPEIALPMKQKVDERREAGMYLLTGSSDPLVAPKLSDSLAGRMFILHLWPLSQAEIYGTQPDFLERVFSRKWSSLQTYPHWSRERMIETLFKGGFPTLQHLSDEMRDEWFNNHVRTLLERDVKDLAQIRKTDDLALLIQLIGNRSGCLINRSELSRTTQISTTTLSFFLSLLDALFLTFKIKAWHKNVTKRMTKSPKIYVVDSGLMTFLQGIDEQRLISQPSLLGPLLETFVVTEIHKLIGWGSMRIQCYHYRTASGIEVDLLLENRSGEVVGVEIKSSETIRAGDFAGLRHLQKELGPQFKRGIVLYPGNECISFGKELYALPISSLWSEGN